MRSFSQVTSEVRRFFKPLIWKVRGSRGPRKIAFILGLQRSGTNMLSEAFDRDWNCMSFGEDDGLALGTRYDHDMRWRWRPLDEVQAVFDSLAAPLIVTKPIVESQRALELLDYFRDSRIIWAYRDYKDVAQSSIALFGAEASMHNLGAVLDPVMRDHWFSQNLSDETRELVRRHFDPQRPLEDLKALGWVVRNSLFFQLELDRNPRVTMSKYEALVSRPVEEMRRLYRFLAKSFPGPHVCAHMHQDSVRKGSQARMSEDIEGLCRELLARLDAAAAASDRRQVS